MTRWFNRESYTTRSWCMSGMVLCVDRKHDRHDLVWLSLRQWTPVAFNNSLHSGPLRRMLFCDKPFREVGRDKG